MLSLCSQNKGGGGREGAESILASSLLFFLYGSDCIYVTLEENESSRLTRMDHFYLV